MGRNDAGQTTVPAEAASGITAISAGGKHNLALKTPVGRVAVIPGTAVAGGVVGVLLTEWAPHTAVSVRIGGGAATLTTDAQGVTSASKTCQPTSRREPSQSRRSHPARTPRRAPSR